MRLRRMAVGLGVGLVFLVWAPPAGAIDYPEIENNGNACDAVLTNPGTREGGKSSRRSAVAGELTTQLVRDACFGF